MNRLDVKVDKLSSILIIVLGLFFVPLGIGSLVNGLINGLKVVPLVIGLMSLVAYSSVVWVVRRGHLKSVKHFSETGIQRQDGRSFSWSELDRVITQVRTGPDGRKVIWRTEIQFKSGESAWLIPNKVSNFVEVSRYVGQLPCEHAEVNVGSL
jgi:hypothetical protein